MYIKDRDSAGTGEKVTN